MTIGSPFRRAALPWVSSLASQLGLSHTVAQKSRRGDRSVEIAFQDKTIIAGRGALIVDDIVSSGGTLMACARALIAAGAVTVDAVVTHALFPEALCREMASSGIRSIRSTHSVPHSTNAIMLDGLFAAALNNELIPAEISR